MPPVRRKISSSRDSGDEKTSSSGHHSSSRSSSKRVKSSHHDSSPSKGFYSNRRSSKSSSSSTTNNDQYSETSSSSANFSTKKCNHLFSEFASPDDPEVIGPEGIENFCAALSVDPEDPVMLVLAYKMDAKQMGYFTRKEWLKGLQDIQCDSIVKIRSKLNDLRSLLYDPNVFKNIYRYSFDFSKDKDQRSMDMETGKGMLKLLLSKNWILYKYFERFLEDSKYRVLNKDQWCNILEFSRSVNPDLSNYDEDGAWPVLLDEFVDWYRKNVLSQNRSSHLKLEPEVITMDHDDD